MIEPIENIPKHLETLFKDKSLKNYMTDEHLVDAAGNIILHMKNSLVERPERRWGYLRASDLGKPCLRQLYLDVTNEPNTETLPASANIKFLYGNIIEDMILTLLKATGKYEVTGQQEVFEQDVNGWKISGRQDCLINGTTVDVKSASSYSFKEYTTAGITSENDKFGYRHQLDYYVSFNQRDLNNGYFLFVDKQLGHVCPVKNDPSVSWMDRAVLITETFNKAQLPDIPLWAEQPEGKSGNMKLSTVCSYCPRKKLCFPEVRTFLYSNGPIYLTQIKNMPKVQEAI